MIAHDPRRTSADAGHGKKQQEENDEEEITQARRQQRRPDRYRNCRRYRHDGIGFGRRSDQDRLRLALTGPLAPYGKQALLAEQIWQERVNAQGGLLGRQVELVYYDDQSNAATVPGIYAKLLDVDKVDLIMGPYATNLVAPAFPVVMPKGKVMIGLFALEVNSHFHYPNYFSMVPYGPDPKVSSAEGFFDVAEAQKPKPQTVAIISEDF